MKSKWLRFALLISVFPPAVFGQYKTALPGYRCEFPRDYFNHEDFQTEWWYTTGNLAGADGHSYGFELTFFRHGMDRDPAKTSAWDIQDVYLAHLALSDLDGARFLNTERTNRAGPGLAGIDANVKRIWNGNWELRWSANNEITLRAIDERFSLMLSMRPEKPPVIHGEKGVSQKAAGAAQASHYISFTRLKTTGTLEANGKSIPVFGTSWMDHEFFTHQLAAGQVGWDWLSVQFADNTELMLYRFRRTDGSVDPFSSGTYVDEQGKSRHLNSSDFQLSPSGDLWTSPVTGAKYPIVWTAEIPELGLKLEATTRLKPQELSGGGKLSPNYWEGAITVQGTRGSTNLRGVGYLEMTGYDRPVEMGQ